METAPARSRPRALVLAVAFFGASGVLALAGAPLAFPPSATDGDLVASRTRPL